MSQLTPIGGSTMQNMLMHVGSGQYVDPTKIIAVLVPLPSHVETFAPLPFPLRSILVLDRSVSPHVPCSLLPGTVHEKITGFWVQYEVSQEARERVRRDRWEAEERNRQMARQQEAAMSGGSINQLAQGPLPGYGIPPATSALQEESKS